MDDRRYGDSFGGKRLCRECGVEVWEGYAHGHDAMHDALARVGGAEKPQEPLSADSLGTVGAQWAEAFVRLHGGDEMIGWFANAIEANFQTTESVDDHTSPHDADYAYMEPVDEPVDEPVERLCGKARDKIAHAAHDWHAGEYLPVGDLGYPAHCRGYTTEPVDEPPVGSIVAKPGGRVVYIRDANGLWWNVATGGEATYADLRSIGYVVIREGWGAPNP